MNIVTQEVSTGKFFKVFFNYTYLFTIFDCTQAQKKSRQCVFWRPEVNNHLRAILLQIENRGKNHFVPSAQKATFKSLITRGFIEPQKKILKKLFFLLCCY